MKGSGGCVPGREPRIQHRIRPGVAAEEPPESHEEDCVFVARFLGNEELERAVRLDGGNVEDFLPR